MTFDSSQSMGVSGAAASLNSPTFTGTATLAPTNKCAAGTTFIECPADGTSQLIISDDFTFGGTADYIGLGPNDGTGTNGGLSLHGTGGSTVNIDPASSGTGIIMASGTGVNQWTFSIVPDPSGGITIGSSSHAQLFFGDNGISLNPGKIVQYNSIATVDNGVPSEIGHADQTGKTAAIAATTLVTPTATGRFRISAYLKVTTAATTSSTLGGVTITFTDGADSVAQSILMAMMSKTGTMETSDSGNTTTTTMSGSLFVYAKAAVAIQYAVAYVSSGATPMAYEVHITCEAM